MNSAKATAIKDDTYFEKLFRNFEEVLSDSEKTTSAVMEKVLQFKVLSINDEIEKSPELEPATIVDKLNNVVARIDDNNKRLESCLVLLQDLI